jgi:hypothetical protein
VARGQVNFRKTPMTIVMMITANPVTAHRRPD